MLPFSRKTFSYIFSNNYLNDLNIPLFPFSFLHTNFNLYVWKVVCLFLRPTQISPMQSVKNAKYIHFKK